MNDAGKGTQRTGAFRTAGSSALHALRIYFWIAISFTAVASLITFSYGPFLVFRTLYDTWAVTVFLFLPLYVFLPPASPFWSYFISVPVITFIGAWIASAFFRDNLILDTAFLCVLTFFGSFTNRRRAALPPRGQNEATQPAAERWSAKRFFLTMLAVTLTASAALAFLSIAPFSQRVPMQSKTILLTCGATFFASIAIAAIQSALRRDSIVPALFAAYFLSLLIVMAAVFASYPSLNPDNLGSAFFIANIPCLLVNILLLPFVITFRHLARK
jgi:hypothetical protein